MLVSEPSGRFLDDLGRAIECFSERSVRSFPEVVVAPGLSMVATDSRHYAPLAHDIYRFLPLRLKAEDLERIHGVDERIAIKDYANLIGFLARLIENSSGAMEKPSSGRSL